ncbi:MAG TPA: hypothetical protein DEA22_12375 [Blastocatellia bacterium]|nr:hypothetical protein [Blastocatellia bacterium]
MKAIILAAGVSSRIHQLTQGLPKCLLRFGEKTILDFQIENLFAAGVKNIGIVVGHGKQHIIEHLETNHPDKMSLITIIENPLYASTNNIYSLWMAREWIGGDGFICLNADVFCHSAILPPAVNTTADISMIIDREWRDETMKVIIEGDRVVRMSKSIPREQASGTYVNITTFSPRICNAFFEEMEAVINGGDVKIFYNVAVERLIAKGVAVAYTDTNGLPWAEIDTPEDFWFAQSHVFPKISADFQEAARDSAVVDSDQA